MEEFTWPEKFIVVDDLCGQAKMWKSQIEDLLWIDQLVKYDEKKPLIPELKEDIKLFWASFPTEQNKMADSLRKLIALKDSYPLTSVVVEKYIITTAENFEQTLKDISKGADTGSAILWLDMFLHEFVPQVKRAIQDKMKIITFAKNDNEIREITRPMGGFVCSHYFGPSTEDPMRILAVASRHPSISFLRELYGEAVTDSSLARSSAERRDVWFSIVLGLNKWVEEIEKKQQHPLDLFWDDTKDWFTGSFVCPHNPADINNAWSDSLQKTMGKFLGPVDNWFENADAVRAIHENVKTLAGKNSCFVLEGSYYEPLSTYAAYIVFLMGAYRKMKTDQLDNSVLEAAKVIDWAHKDSAREANLFSSNYSSDKKDLVARHQKCAKAIFRLGELLAFNRMHQGECNIMEPRCHDKVVVVRLKNIDFLNFIEKSEKTIKENDSNGDEVKVSTWINFLYQSEVFGNKNKGGYILFDCVQEKEKIIRIHLIHGNYRWILLGGDNR